MDLVRWGIVGCGDVTEVKSGPALQKASGSELVAVTRRNLDKARDFARRHGVPRVHETAAALIDDRDVDAVYIATPPSSHCELALRVAAAGKPCLVEKPMAMTHDECLRMIEAFRAAGAPLWVAYYRRALPRFVFARSLLAGGAIGTVTSVRVEVFDRLAPHGWRIDPDVGGAGLFFDLGSHCVDILDFLIGRIEDVHGVAINTGGAYAAEDVTAAAFTIEGRIAGTGTWNFNAADKRDAIVCTGTAGELHLPVFADGDIVVRAGGTDTVHHFRNPPHVHQPLIEAIVGELRGQGRCESTGESAARASRVLEQCVAGYYRHLVSDRIRS